MKNLQITAIALLCFGLVLAILALISYQDFLSLTRPELAYCDSCLPASETALGRSFVFGVLATVGILGSPLAFMMDRKREYLKAHGYL